MPYLGSVAAEVCAPATDAGHAGDAGDAGDAGHAGDAGKCYASCYEACYAAGFSAAACDTNLYVKGQIRCFNVIPGCVP